MSTKSEKNPFWKAVSLLVLSSPWKFQCQFFLSLSHTQSLSLFQTHTHKHTHTHTHILYLSLMDLVGLFWFFCFFINELYLFPFSIYLVLFNSTIIWVLCTLFAGQSLVFCKLFLFLSHFQSKNEEKWCKKEEKSIKKGPLKGGKNCKYRKTVYCWIPDYALFNATQINFISD